MARMTFCFFLAAALAAGTPVSAQAQTRGAANQTTTEMGPRQQLATIIFAGLAGAILGLSTLSFYGRPQDKLSNIGVGFAVGIIIGTGYTTYLAATKPYRNFDPDAMLMPWQNGQDLRFAVREGSVPKIGYTWEF